jgi:uncharacterized RDD family membrane protein YckC
MTSDAGSAGRLPPVAPPPDPTAPATRPPDAAAPLAGPPPSTSAAPGGPVPSPGTGPSGSRTPPGGWSPPPPGPAPGLMYADFWIRLVAYIVDSIILVIPGLILNGIFVTRTVIVFFGSGRVDVDVAGLFLVALLQVAISAVYFTYTWTRYRASPGQRLFGLLVLNQADGSPLGTNQALTRWLFLAGPGALSSLITGHAVIGGVVGLFVFGWYVYLAYTTATDPRRQVFHDRSARTVVVRPILPA